MSSPAPTAHAHTGVVNGHTASSPYNYTPSAPANIAFLVIFSILTLLHSGLGLKHRTWFFSGMMVLGGLGEVIGYIGRVGSAYDVTLNNYFIVQIVCLIIAPAFFSAALYVTIGKLAVIVGQANAYFKPMYYVIVFSTFDVIALTIQSIGGAGASKAEQDGTDTTNSTHIMEAGIVVQAAGNIVFTIAVFILWHRTVRNSRAQGVPTPFPKTKGFKMFVAAMLISDAAILLRAAYRVVELAQGWNGYLISTQPWFYGFDTALMIICMAVWVIGHPGITLGRELSNISLRSQKAVDMSTTTGEKPDGTPIEV